MAVVKNRNSKPSTRPKKFTKKVTSLDVNKKFGFYNVKQLSEAKLDELAKQIILWVEDDKPKLFFEEFLFEFKIHREKMERHLKKSEALRDAKAYAMQVISFHREKKAYNTNYWAAFRHTQGLYSPSWKAQEIHFNDLKTKVSAATGSVEKFQEGMRHVLKEIDEGKVDPETEDSNE